MTDLAAAPAQDAPRGPLAVLGALNVRVIVPAWILAGATVKMLEAAPSFLPMHSILRPARALDLDLQWLLWALVSIEIVAAFAMTLIPRPPRPLAIMILSVFCGVLVYEMTRGAGSCGCFGSKSPPPATMLAVDAVMLLGAILLRPARERLLPESVRWAAAAVLGVAGAGVAWSYVDPGGEVRRADEILTADADDPDDADETTAAEDAEDADDATAADDADDADDDAGAADEAPAEPTVDLDGLRARIVAMPVPQLGFRRVIAGPEGVVFLAEDSYAVDATGLRLHRFSTEDLEAAPFLDGITSASVSHDGTRLLYAAPGGTWGVVWTSGSPSVGEGRIDVGSLRARIDPAAEWGQIFEEAWRLHRDYFYVENLHGADWDAVRERYAPLVGHVAHRSDLTHLIDKVGGAIAVALGHPLVGF